MLLLTLSLCVKALVISAMRSRYVFQTVSHPARAHITGALTAATSSLQLGCQTPRIDFNSSMAVRGETLGVAAKLAHNYLSGIIFIAEAEAMNMGMRAGLDARVLANVFSAGAAQSTIMDRFNPVPGELPDAPSSKNYTPGFKIQLHCKDFGLAIDMANEVGSRLALGGAGLQTFKGAIADPRCKDLDSSIIYRYLGGVEDWPGREF